MAAQSTLRRRPYQVYLDEYEAELLARAAEAAGTSKADVLRAAVRRLARELVVPQDDPAWQLVGLAGTDADSPGDLAVNHDEYLASIGRENHASAPAAGPTLAANEDRKTGNAGGDG